MKNAVLVLAMAAVVLAMVFGGYGFQAGAQATECDWDEVALVLIEPDADLLRAEFDAAIELQLAWFDNNPFRDYWDPELLAEWEANTVALFDAAYEQTISEWEMIYETGDSLRDSRCATWLLWYWESCPPEVTGRKILRLLRSARTQD